MGSNIRFDSTTKPYKNGTVNKKNGHKTANQSKKKVLNATEFKNICIFIHKYNGLAIDCELQMEKKFWYADRQSLKSILAIELNMKLRSTYWRYAPKAKEIVAKYRDDWDECSNDSILKIAIAEKMSPAVLCRAVLQVYSSSKNVSQVMKYPNTISNLKLRANVELCICSDIHEGPLIDLRRRLVGEEYEVKLLEKARMAGLYFFGEKDLRRLGYDKTPDLKLKVPILYKNQVIHWIESKAYFGDPRSHKINMKQQLGAYLNRFGPGIVIYWFGFHEDIMKENKDIIVLHDFPNIEDLESLNEDKEDANASKDDSPNTECI